jgi:hypothetical protein
MRDSATTTISGLIIFTCIFAFLQIFYVGAGVIMYQNTLDNIEYGIQNGRIKDTSVCNSNIPKYYKCTINSIDKKTIEYTVEYYPISNRSDIKIKNTYQTSRGY